MSIIICYKFDVCIVKVYLCAESLNKRAPLRASSDHLTTLLQHKELCSRLLVHIGLDSHNLAIFSLNSTQYVAKLKHELKYKV